MIIIKCGQCGEILKQETEENVALIYYYLECKKCDLRYHYHEEHGEWIATKRVVAKKVDKAKESD